MIEEITAFKVGVEIFRTKEQAETYDNKQNLIEYFNRNPLYGESTRIDGEELVEFIDKHDQVLERYLSIIFQDVS